MLPSLYYLHRCTSSLCLLSAYKLHLEAVFLAVKTTPTRSWGTLCFQTAASHPAFLDPESVLLWTHGSGWKHRLMWCKITYLRGNQGRFNWFNTVMVLAALPDGRLASG
jgi:hypothetical protein